MKGAALLCLGVAATVVMPASAPQAMVAEQQTWSRFTAQNQAFSVELPCTAADVAVQSPAMARHRRVDPAGVVGCVHEGRVFMAAQSTLPESHQQGANFYDILRDAIMQSPAPTTVQISQSTYQGRRMLVSRETSGATGARVQIVELNDRSCLMLLASGELRDTMMATALQADIDRFLASAEIAS